MDTNRTTNLPQGVNNEMSVFSIGQTNLLELAEVPHLTPTAANTNQSPTTTAEGNTVNWKD